MSEVLISHREQVRVKAELAGRKRAHDFLAEDLRGVFAGRIVAALERPSV